MCAPPQTQPLASCPPMPQKVLIFEIGVFTEIINLQCNESQTSSPKGGHVDTETGTEVAGKQHKDAGGTLEEHKDRVFKLSRETWSTPSWGPLRASQVVINDVLLFKPPTSGTWWPRSAAASKSRVASYSHSLAIAQVTLDAQGQVKFRIGLLET